MISILVGLYIIGAFVSWASLAFFNRAVQDEALRFSIAEVIAMPLLWPLVLVVWLAMIAAETFELMSWVRR